MGSFVCIAFSACYSGGKPKIGFKDDSLPTSNYVSHNGRFIVGEKFPKWG